VRRVQQFDVATALLRVVFGLFLAYHGWNKVFGGNGLSGTAGWFQSIGMRRPMLQARLAAGTEIGAGVAFAAGLLTALAAGAIVAVMLVAIVVAHWKVGLFIFLPDQGWEYCASIAVVATAVAIMGPGRWSIDHALGVHIDGWAGAAVALGLGIGGALLQLITSYRPESR
jgi:putative oxidoreductase